MRLLLDSNAAACTIRWCILLYVRRQVQIILTLSQLGLAALSLSEMAVKQNITSMLHLAIGVPEILVAVIISESPRVIKQDIT